MGRTGPREATEQEFAGDPESPGGADEREVHAAPSKGGVGDGGLGVPGDPLGLEAGQCSRMKEQVLFALLFPHVCSHT